MKEFKTKKSKETYHRVLTTAMNLFNKLGYEKTTMRAISKEAELGLGALYYYFPSKEAIVTTFYEQLNREISEEWCHMEPSDQALDTQLREFLTFKLQKMEPYRPLMRVLLKEAVDPESSLSPLSSESKPALDTSVEIFERMVEAGEQSQQVAKFLWLGHLVIIGLWVHKPDKVQAALSAFAELAPLMGIGLASGSLGELIDDLV